MFQVRVAASKFRKGGTLCALCACRFDSFGWEIAFKTFRESIYFSPRVNLFKLGGKVQQGQVQVPALGLVQNFEDWQVCYNMFFSVKKLYDFRSAKKLYDSRSAKK